MKGFRPGKHYVISQRALKQACNCIKLLADIKPSAGRDLHALISYLKKSPSIDVTGDDKKPESYTFEELLASAKLRSYKDKN